MDHIVTVVDKINQPQTKRNEFVINLNNLGTLDQMEGTIKQTSIKMINKKERERERIILIRSVINLV